mgnify:CR=1 FL=1
MCAKKAKTTKKKIVSAAWKLFYEQGYDNTTVDDIVEESGTSKGSFYHYFEGKGNFNLLFHVTSPPCFSALIKIRAIKQAFKKN